MNEKNIAKKDEKNVATEETTVEATEETTNEEEITVAGTNGNGSYGKRKIKLADMPTLSFTKTAYGKLDPEALAAALVDPENPAINRISRERGLALLVERIETGRITLTPEALADLTYKKVVVEKIELPKGVRGVLEPVVTLTATQFKDLKPAEAASYVAKYLHKRRAADVIIPGYVKAGMPLTAVDMVSLTNNRVAIKGVVVSKAGATPPKAVTAGVEFG